MNHASDFGYSILGQLPAGSKLPEGKAACDAYDAAFDEWHPVPRQYEAGDISYHEYFTARRKFEAATAAWEAARALAYPGR